MDTRSYKISKCEQLMIFITQYPLIGEILETIHHYVLLDTSEWISFKTHRFNKFFIIFTYRLKIQNLLANTTTKK
jgi:hypothetical protein